MHRILHNCCPPYLADLVTFNTVDSQRRQLRSTTTRSVVVRRTRTPLTVKSRSVFFLVLSIILVLVSFNGIFVLVLTFLYVNCV